MTPESSDSVLFVLSPKGSLNEMARSGQLDRFLEYYVDAYSREGFAVGVLSFGARADEHAAAAGSRIDEVIAPERASGWSWAALAPLHQRRTLRKYRVWRALQASGSLTLALGRWLHKATVLTTYGYDYVEFALRAGHNHRARLLRGLLRLALPRIPYVIVTSETVRASALAAGAKPQSLVFIPNASAVADTPSSRRRPRSVLWVGRIAPQKRIDIAVEAALRADAALTVVGQGELPPSQRQRLERAAGRFLGPVSNREVLDLLDEHEVFFLTSEYEGTPKVVIEALARGTAALVPTLPEIEWLYNRSPPAVATFIVGDMDSAAHALRGLLDDPIARERVAQAGHALARERFDIRRAVAREIELVHHRVTVTA